MPDPTASFATAQVQAGYVPGVAQNTAVVPIYQSNGYEFPSLAHARDDGAERPVRLGVERAPCPEQLQPARARARVGVVRDGGQVAARQLVAARGGEPRLRAQL